MKKLNSNVLIELLANIFEQKADSENMLMKTKLFSRNLQLSRMSLSKALI